MTFTSNNQPILRIMNYFISTDDDNVMLFSEQPIGCSIVAEFAASCGLKVNDVCEVPDNDCQYYIYSPVWIDSDEKRERLTAKAKKWSESQSEEQISAFYKRLGLKVPRYHNGYLMPMELR